MDKRRLTLSSPLYPSSVRMRLTSSLITGVSGVCAPFPRAARADRLSKMMRDLAALRRYFLKSSWRISGLPAPSIIMSTGAARALPFRGTRFRGYGVSARSSIASARTCLMGGSLTFINEVQRTLFDRGRERRRTRERSFSGVTFALRKLKMAADLIIGSCAEGCLTGN